MKRIVGDLITDDNVIFDEDIVVIGSLRAKSIKTKCDLKVGGSLEVGMWLEVGGSLKVGGSLEVGEYINDKYEILDLSKIKTSRIRFASSYEVERSFWFMILEPLDGIGELRAVIENTNNCWADILVEAQKVKDILLSSNLPAVINQAITVMLADD
jgi:predicted acyltransferase (DUF342 family)